MKANRKSHKRNFKVAKVNKMSRADILGGILPRANKKSPNSKYAGHLEQQAERLLNHKSRRF